MVEQYIKTLADDEFKFNKISRVPATTTVDNKRGAGFASFFSFARLTLRSAVDFIELYLQIKFNQNSIRHKNIVYTDRNFCNLVDGKFMDRILKPLSVDNIIFINQSKEKFLSRINNQKVYNLGGMVKLFSLFYRSNSKSIRLFCAYTAVNNLIIGNLRQNNVYMLLFYNLNGLSLMFSNFRKNITLIEIQHGSIINYPPYVKPSPVKAADVFYVKNESTIDYLKSHLAANYSAEYRLIPCPSVRREFVPGLHLLYASTVEFNGLHPVMQEFLATFHHADLHLIIRLHPREKAKEPLFAEQLEKYGVNYRFDGSENWLTGNTIKNLVVISPWSSAIEDACDNHFPTIVIDPVGRKRYAHLIDNRSCFYSDNLSNTFARLLSTRRDLFSL